MSDGPSRYARTASRPLELALAIRSGIPILHMDGTLDTADVRTRRSGFAGAVPVVLDQVSDWWDSVGNNKWPDDRLDPMGRLPWPKVWAEWREHTRDDALVGLLMLEQPREKALLSYVGTPMVGAESLHGDFLVTLQWYSKPHGVNKIVVAPPIVYGARSSGESFDNPNGNLPFATYREKWPPHFRATDMLETYVVWRLFTALLRVRGTVVQEVDIPRAVRRQYARIADDAAPWITYKTLSVDLALPGTAKSHDQSTAPNTAPRGVPLHLVRAHIADYREGKGLFGKYRGLVWKSAHRRGYERLGVVSKTYEPSVTHVPQV